MESDRRRFITGIGAAGIAGLAGCSGGPTASTETGGTAMDGIDVGMVYATGGLGDGSFNDQAQQGLFGAEEDFSLNYNEVQPDEVSEFQSFQQQFAESTDPAYDLVCCIGFLQADALGTTSGNYPDQRFMIVDSVVEGDNVSSYVFREQEGSYLAGEMAARLTAQEFSAGAGATVTDSATVGFVGGVESDLIRRFEAGFTAGAAAGPEDVEVLTNYVGDFNDPSGGREAAGAMYNDGADVVYHAAGNTGTGVFQAAQEQGRFALGVDRAQSVTKSSFSDVILGSMIKRVDTAVYNAIQSVAQEEFQGGSVVDLGLAEDGVGLVYGDELGSSVPSSVKDEISSSRQAIIDGDVEVPTDPDNV